MFSSHAVAARCRSRRAPLGRAFLALSFVALEGCVTNADRCPSGFDYSSQYDACLGEDAGAPDASPSAPDSASPVDAEVEASADAGGERDQ